MERESGDGSSMTRGRPHYFAIGDTGRKAKAKAKAKARGLMVFVLESEGSLPSTSLPATRNTSA